MLPMAMVLPGTQVNVLATEDKVPVGPCPRHGSWVNVYIYSWVMLQFHCNK
jgi:hypothetical protein